MSTPCAVIESALLYVVLSDDTFDMLDWTGRGKRVRASAACCMDCSGGAPSLYPLPCRCLRGTASGPTSGSTRASASSSSRTVRGGEGSCEVRTHTP